MAVDEEIGGACNIRTFECKRCGASWMVNNILPAVCCPTCGSKKWDRPTDEELEEEKISARIQAVTPWVMEKSKMTKAGPKVYRYWMASWREAGKVVHHHLGSVNKMDFEVAKFVAESKKSKFLGAE